MEKDQTILQKLRDAVVGLDEDLAIQAAKEALAAGIDPVEAMNSLTKGVREVGDKFERLELFLSEMMIASDIMSRATEILQAGLKSTIRGKGVIILGTVAGDIHDIGKSIVCAMLRSSGFTVHDIGKDIASQNFVQEAEKHAADLIAMSALLSTSIPSQEEVIALLKDSGLRNKFKVIVGGAPVTQEVAQEMGADGYGKDATEAVRIAEKLLTNA